MISTLLSGRAPYGIAPQRAVPMTSSGTAPVSASTAARLYGSRDRPSGTLDRAYEAPTENLGLAQRDVQAQAQPSSYGHVPAKVSTHASPGDIKTASQTRTSAQVPTQQSRAGGQASPGNSKYSHVSPRVSTYHTPKFPGHATSRVPASRQAAAGQSEQQRRDMDRQTQVHHDQLGIAPQEHAKAQARMYAGDVAYERQSYDRDTHDQRSADDSRAYAAKTRADPTQLVDVRDG